jgi:acetyl-CoA carboxylase biotin carboxyl carrier protein
MDIEQISRLAELMTENDLSEISLQTADVKLKLKRGFEPVVAAPMAAPAPVAVHAAAGAAAPAHDAAADDAAAPAATIASPIVGTFYAAPAPDAPPFVKVGDTVDADTVVCIVEAMKVMNEIKAEQCGVIRKVLVDNATPVEFGQPLFEIDPA